MFTKQVVLAAVFETSLPQNDACDPVQKLAVKLVVSRSTSSPEGSGIEVLVLCWVGLGSWLRYVLYDTRALLCRVWIHCATSPSFYCRTGHRDGLDLAVDALLFVLDTIIFV